MDAGLVLAVEILNFSKMLNVLGASAHHYILPVGVENLMVTLLLVVSCGVVL